MFGKIKKQKALQYNKIAQQAIVAGVLEVSYIFFVSLFMVAGEAAFSSGNFGQIFGIMAFLVLFVVSVGVSALLVLCYPAYYMLQKKYNEAVIYIAFMLATMFVIFALFLFVGILL